MTITFPRELPSGIGFRVRRFEPIRAVAASRSNNRTVNRSQIADPVWVADLETVPLKYHERMEVEAWVQSLRGGLRKVLYRHQLSCFPKAHPVDGGVAVNPGSLVSVASGNEITVNVASTGLSLSPGDLIGLEATHRALGIATAVSGTGNTRVITIEPEPPADVAVFGAVVRFVSPGVVMALVPQSFKVSTANEGQWVLSFSLEETR